jgi:hypothetical protein
MSVAIGDVLAAHNEPAESLIDGYDGYALISITAGEVRQAQLAVCRDEHPDDPAHGLVVGKKTGGRQRALARACQWQVPPTNACDPPYE